MSAPYYILVLIGAAYGHTPVEFPERFKTEEACRTVGEKWSFPVPYHWPGSYVEPRFKCLRMKEADEAMTEPAPQ